MAKEPKQKSVLYLESQPFRLPGRVPSPFTSVQWRRTAAEPTNQAYQGHLSRALKLEYKFVAKKGEDPKGTKVKEIVKYYEELFEKCYWDLTKVAWEKDSYDLPFGGSLEIGWWPDTAFGGKFPAGYPAWFVHVDAGTMWVNQNSKYPYAQIDPNNHQKSIAFKRREIARMMYVPHTSLALRGYQKSPTEQNYQVIGALARLYTYDLKALSDTPIAGILDLMDFSEDDAVEWAKGFKEMMMGIDVIKIPILYEHEKPAQFVPFGQPVVDVKEKWKHYAEKCGNPYGLTIGSLGLYEHDRTLAGARIQRITTQRTGVGGFAYDEKRAINRQLFPPGCPVKFEWDVPEIEDKLKLEQARGTRAAYMKMYVEAGALKPEDMLEQGVEDGIFTIPVKPGAIEVGISGTPKPPPEQPKPTGTPKPQGKYPEYPPATKAAHIVEETLLLKQDVGDDLEQTEAYKLMQEVLAGQLYGKKVNGLITSLFGGLRGKSDVEKGGPGSGNWGHKGRKGKRGGSARSGGRAAAVRGTLTSGRAKASFERFTFEEDIGGGEIYRSDETYVAEALAEDLSKLPAYEDTPPVTVMMWPDPDTEGIVDAGYEGNPDVKYDTWTDAGPVAGMYNPKSNTIYLNPTQLQKDRFSPEVDLNLARKVFAHEYGHHVTIQRNHPKNPGPGQFNPTSVFNNQTLSKLRALPAEKLADLGLVDHAISSLDELASETYALSLYGSGSQNKALSDFYGKPLDEVLREL